jgi:hypothetical protein
VRAIFHNKTIPIGHQQLEAFTSAFLAIHFSSLLLKFGISLLGVAGMVRQDRVLCVMTDADGCRDVQMGRKHSSVD